MCLHFYCKVSFRSQWLRLVHRIIRADLLLFYLLFLFSSFTISISLLLSLPPTQATTYCRSNWTQHISTQLNTQLIVYRCMTSWRWLKSGKIRSRRSAQMRRRGGWRPSDCRRRPQRLQRQRRAEWGKKKSVSRRYVTVTVTVTVNFTLYFIRPASIFYFSYLPFLHSIYIVYSQYSTCETKTLSNYRCIPLCCFTTYYALLSWSTLTFQSGAPQERKRGA